MEDELCRRAVSSWSSQHIPRSHACGFAHALGRTQVPSMRGRPTKSDLWLGALTVVLLVAHQLQSQMSRCCEGPRRSRCRSSASAARSEGAVAPANRSPRAAGETEGTGTDHASNSSKPYLAY